MRRICYAAILLVFGIGIGYLSAATKNAARDSLTADELAAGLGANWWTLEVPPNHHDASLMFAVLAADDKKYHFGFTGSSGDKFKVFLWNLQGEQLEYSIFGGQSRVQQSGEIKNPLKKYTQRVTRRIGAKIIPGQPVIVASNGPISSSAPDEIGEGQVGLAFVLIEPSKD